jgi:hypothetical protein
MTKKARRGRARRWRLRPCFLKATLAILLPGAPLDAGERFLLAADHQVIEVDRAGTVTEVLKHPGHGGIYDASRLPDGGIVYAHRGGLALFDASKKLVMEHKAVAGSKGAEANSVAVLEGGERFALMDSGVNEIRIVDRGGVLMGRTPLPDLEDDPLHFRYRMIREVPGANAFWVGQYGRKTVLKVEKDTGRVLQGIPLDPLLKPSPAVKKAFATLQEGDGSLWVTTSTGRAGNSAVGRSRTSACNAATSSAWLASQTETCSSPAAIITCKRRRKDATCSPRSTRPARSSGS